LCKFFQVFCRPRKIYIKFATIKKNISEEGKFGVSNKMKVIASLVTNLLQSGTMCINYGDELFRGEEG